MMTHLRSHLFWSMTLAVLALCGPAGAASHREAPLISEDPRADNTDVYAFVSYDQANLDRPADQRRVTLIANWIPLEEPSGGPNYFNFSDNVLYEIHIDNNEDGDANDIVYQFRFRTEDRPLSGVLTSPLSYLGGVLTSGITSLDGPGSDGLLRRQTYTVTEVRNRTASPLFGGQTLYAVPANVGPATMPDYEDLASQGIYTDGDMRVFAGQRDEAFYIDLGATFDTLSLRRDPPYLNPTEDDDHANDPFGVDMLSGFNVHSIAVEVPITHLTADGLPADATSNPVIGVYASAGRQRGLRFLSDGTRRGSGPVAQVSRLANPLINELVIHTPFKDFWNVSAANGEAQFQSFYKDPILALLMSVELGVSTPPPPRTDLLAALLKYPGQPLAGTDCGNPCADLLRLDLRVPPTAAESQDRRGSVIGSDPGGYPNGRRPGDDVVDIALRLVGGTLLTSLRLGDGVNHNAGAPGAGTSDGPGYGAIPGNRLDVTTNGIAIEFPFLPTPHQGRNRQHIDCDEAGANPCEAGF